jgi:hypothetical protein
MLYYADQYGCRKRLGAGEVIDCANNVDLDELDSSSSTGRARTASGRKVRKTNALNMMFNSRYRYPENVKTLMGELQQLGMAFAIIIVVTHWPNLPTELADHNLCHSLFIEAAKYALSDEETQTILAHPDQEEKRIYYHNLLITSCCPLTTTLYNEGRVFFQTRVFGCSIHNAVYKLHLRLGAAESVFDQ